MTVNLLPYISKGKRYIKFGWCFYQNYIESKIQRFLVKIIPLGSVELVIQTKSSPLGRFWKIVRRCGEPTSMEGRGFTIHFYPFHLYLNFWKGAWTDIFFRKKKAK